MSSSLMKHILFFYLVIDIKSTATRVNSACKPQIKQHLLTTASEEEAKLPPASRSVVDQDMVNWFEELFGKETLPLPSVQTPAVGAAPPPPPPPLFPPKPTPQGMFPTWRPHVVLDVIEPRSYSLRDIDHKSLYLKDENLVAAPLQGDNPAEEEILSVLPNRSLDRKRFPLILGVNEGSQGISCGKEAQPKLQLEDAKLINLFSNYEEAKRFTFFKSYNGSTHTFESASHPGWYLSTSVEAHKPLMLTSTLGEATITNFYFLRN